MEGNADGSSNMDVKMDVGDSRKRPLDVDSDHLTTKRSNYGQAGEVLLKQLIPSHLAGVILGKGGETIVGIQTETGSTIKMSKGNDFYPGTTDRVCVIMGPASCVREAHDAIWEKIRNRVDTSKIGIEELQVKVVIPNATIGMIIGKGGCYIKQIKDDTGAFVQISQKSSDAVLVERVVTIAGSVQQISEAFEMIFKVIINDPQSGSCPNISYSEVKGPVANANPIGSPFAVGGMDAGGGGFPGANAVMYGGAVAPHSVETLKSTLRNSGFSVQASDEITAAMCTLANYGLLGSGFGFAGFGFGAGPGQCGLTLDFLMGILSGCPDQRAPNSLGMPAGGRMQKTDKNAAGQFPNRSDMFTAGGGMVNQNSFGLGTGMGQHGRGHEGSLGNQTKELQISENIVGAVLGHGGRAIVEIQRITSTTIQISKKGVFAPGTRNRIATISGPGSGVERAMMLVQQCIQQEESKRSRQEKMLK